MKNLFKYFMMLLLGIGVISCEKDVEEPEEEIEWTLSDPIITSPASAELIDLEGAETFNIAWDPAISSEDTYAVTYKVNLSFDSHLYLDNVSTGNNGKDTSIDITSSELDNFLNLKEIPAGAEVNAVLTVTATALTKSTSDEDTFEIKRTLNEEEITISELFISGTSTEGGDNIENAIQFRRLKDASRQDVNEFEVFTELKADGEYKFFSAKTATAYAFGEAEEAGLVEFGGKSLSVDEDGIYRIYLNFDAKTYEVEKFDSWGMIGGPLLGWNEDVDLEYQGAGIWKANMIFNNAENMVFRANDDWAIQMHVLKGTSEVMLDSRRNAIGLSEDDTEDVVSPGAGAYIVTLDLSATGYTYNIEIDPDAGGNAPESLFLLADGVMIKEFVAGEIPGMIVSEGVVPMETGIDYIFNTSSDGSGTNYTLTSNVDGGEGVDQVYSKIALEMGDTPFTVALNQAYKFDLDFNNNEANWKYYNIKLFHWDEDNAGWESRTEGLMEYTHPLTYTVTMELTAGYHSKMFSPWELVYCVATGEDSSSLSGNFERFFDQELEVAFQNIVETGTYEVTIVVNEDLSGGTYDFVKQ